MLQFPFWLAIPTGAVSSEQIKGYGECQPWIFSSAEKMGAFLGAHKDVQWETKLVDRYSAPAVLAALAAMGYTTVCQDAKEDSSGRATIAVAEILAAIR